MFKEIFSLHDKPLSPYLDTSAYGDDRSALSFALHAHAEAQLGYLLHELLPELHSRLTNLLPSEMPVWLGRGKQSAALRRVRHMLQQVNRVLSAPAHPLSGNQPHSSKAHSLLYFRGGRAVTSPVLLAIQALLFSHSAWGTESYLHDVKSAARASELLAHHSDPIRQWIVFLIAWHNVFRTCVGSNKESTVLVRDTQGNISLRDDLLPEVLAEHLKNGFEAYREGDIDWKEGLLSALWLVSEGYESREGDKVEHALFEALGKTITRSWERSQGSGGDSVEGDRWLVVFEYGHYVFKDNACPKREAIAQRVLSKCFSGGSHGVAWISLDRYWATHHGHRLVDIDDLERLFVDVGENVDRPASLPWRGQAVFYHLDLESEVHWKEAYFAAFGVCPPANGPDAWQLITHSLVKSFPEPSRVPWAYVMRVLEVLAHISRYRESFWKLRVCFPANQCDPEVGVSASWIYLPKACPSVREVETAIENRDWRNARLVVARTLSALLWNQRMTFGNTLQFLEAEERCAQDDWLNQWWELARITHERFHAKKQFEHYLQVYTSAPIQNVLRRPRLPRMTVPANRERKDDGYVLGVDIGGGGVKWAVYSLGNGPEHSFSVRGYGQYPTAPNKGTPKYRDAKAFVKRLREELENHSWPPEWSWERCCKELRAVGVTWPGAVSGPLAHESVRAPSGVLQYFEGFKASASIPGDGKVFFEADAQDLRRLEVREAFAEAFFGDAGDDRVTLINDGVAHVLNAWSATAGDLRGRVERAIIIAAGTGTAMGAINARTGRVLDILAEPGKVVVYVGMEAGTDGVTGLGRDAFNKLALSTAAGEEAKGLVGSVGGVPKIESLVIGYLLARSRMRGHNLDPALQEELDTIGGTWKTETAGFGTFQDLPAHVADLRAKLGLEDEERFQDFAVAVAARVGCQLADLVALTWELFRSRTVFISGGPMTGSSGEFVHQAACKALRERYGFHVVEKPGQSDPGQPHHLARRIVIGKAPAIGEGPSGAHGAALAALQLLL